MFSLRSTLRSWLGLDDAAALIAGQRKDFDALGDVLQQRDRRILVVEDHIDQLNRAAGQAFGELYERLDHHERLVPALKKSRQSLNAARQRKLKRAETDAKAKADPAVAGTIEPATPAGDADTPDAPGA